MGQGNSEGTASEESTSDAPQGQADHAAPASPNGPTPTEADTATRQVPVVKPDQDETATADGPTLETGDDTPQVGEDDPAAGEDDPAAGEDDPSADEDESGTGTDEVQDDVTEAEPGSAETEAAPVSAAETAEAPSAESEPDGAATDTVAGSVAQDRTSDAAPIVDADADADDNDNAADDNDNDDASERGPSEQPSQGAEPESSDAESNTGGTDVEPVTGTERTDIEPSAEPEALDTDDEHLEVEDEPSEDLDETTPAVENQDATSHAPSADSATEATPDEESIRDSTSQDAPAAAIPAAVQDEPTEEPVPAPAAPVRTPVADRAPTSEPDTSDEPQPTPDDPFGDPRNSATMTGIAASTGETVLPETTTVLPVVGDKPAEPAADHPAVEDAEEPTASDNDVSDRADRGQVSSVPETTPIVPVAAAAASHEQVPDPTPPGVTAPVTEGSPLDVFESEPTGKRRWWRPVLIVAGVLVVLGGAYVGGAYALADRVPRGITVAGIEVGGMSAADARAALTEGLSERSTQPITVTAREVSGSVDPATAGLSLDVEATVDSLTGVDLRPQRMWQHLAGGSEESPVTAVDEAKLDAALTDLGGALTLAPVDGSVVFVDGQAQGVAAVDGWSLDVEGARSTLEDGWLTEALPIELPSDTVTPTITQDEVDRVVRDVASAVTSGPVTVGVAGQSAELPVDVLVGAASFAPQDDELVLQMDGAALVDQVITRTANLLTTAADAKFEFQDGAPVIVPGTPGTTLDPTALGTAVATAAQSTSERTASVELVESDPAQSTEALQELGVSAAVSEFSTPLTSEPKRTKNIAAGAAAINGTLIRPGETFSLTEALGPIDAAHGFVQAGAIVNGEHSDAWGGGLSQLSTTTFNAAFEAGMEDVEHTPHSEWFTRYPAGREATLYTGSIDMKWKNTTPYGVLVQAYVADGRTWVRLWSTPYYEVSISSGAKTNVVAPTTVYNTSPTCSASSAGNSGFSISVTRTVSLNGEVQTTDNLSWRYKAQNRVVCGADPATAAPPAG